MRRQQPGNCAPGACPFRPCALPTARIPVGRDLYAGCTARDHATCFRWPACTGDRLNASITPSMIGRSVGKKPSEPRKEKPCFGDQAPAFDPNNARRLGDSLLKPVHDSPSFCGEEDRFETDACATEQRQRQIQQQRYQVQHCPLGHCLAAGI